MITKYFIHKRIAKAVSSSRTVSLTDFTEAKTIALVSTMLNVVDFQVFDQEVIRLSPKSEKRFFCFAGKKIELPEEIQSGKVHKITAKDFNFFGIPLPSLTKKLNGQHFDLLINVDPANALMSHYLSAVIPANFKVGLSAGIFDPLYDLTLRLQENQTHSEFFTHLGFYLNALKGKMYEK